jgi:hypothetical protein
MTRRPAAIPKGAIFSIQRPKPGPEMWPAFGPSGKGTPPAATPARTVHTSKAPPPMNARRQTTAALRMLGPYRLARAWNDWARAATGAIHAGLRGRLTLSFLGACPSTSSSAPFRRAQGSRQLVERSAAGQAQGEHAVVPDGYGVKRDQREHADGIGAGAYGLRVPFFGRATMSP